jgi:hypothetical protein
MWGGGEVLGGRAGLTVDCSPWAAVDQALQGIAGGGMGRKGDVGMGGGATSR